MNENIGWLRVGLFAVMAAGASAQDEQEVVKRAHKLQQDGDRAGALALLDAAIGPETTNVALWMLRAEARFHGGALEDALADCNRGLELLVPEGGFAVLVGESEGKRSAIGASVRLRGVVRGKLGDWRGSAKDFADATALMPQHGQYWRERSYAEQNLGRFDDTIASLGKAIELHDRDEVTYRVFRNQAYQLAGRGAEARADLERAATLAANTPAAGSVELERAILATALGDAAAARAACDRVAAAEPGLAGWIALLRWSNAGRDELEATTKRLREDFAAKPADDPLVAELFGLCADGTGDADGMLLTGRDTTASCPLWYFGGCRAARLGRDAEARVRFLRCVNTGRPDYAQWRLALARLRATAGKKPLLPALGATVAAVAGAETPTLAVTALAADGAAAIQGLRVGDRLLRVNDQAATLAAFGAMTKGIAIGTPVRFVVVRSGATSELVVTTGVAAP